MPGMDAERASNGPSPAIRRAALARAAGTAGRGALAAAVVVAAATGCAALAIVAGSLTLLGWGVVVVVALVAIAAVLLLHAPAGRGWLILPLLALAVPAVAVAASGVRVAPQRGAVVERPATPAAIPADGYRAGFGELLVDLRRLAVPAGGTTVIRARADLQRTVVALPRGRCFDLDVRWRTGSLDLPGVDEHAAVSGLDWSGSSIAEWARRERSWEPPLARGRIALFGRVRAESRGRWTAAAPRPGAPTLRIELRSEGGSFVVRDYPDDIGPLGSSGWPRNVQPPARPSELREAWARPAASRSSRRAWKRFDGEHRAFVAHWTALLNGACHPKGVLQ